MLRVRGDRRTSRRRGRDGPTSRASRSPRPRRRVPTRRRASTAGATLPRWSSRTAGARGRDASTRHSTGGRALGPPYPARVLECVPNVSEGRDPEVLDALAAACGDALLDRHVDADHHRSVFTLAGRTTPDTVRSLARAVAERVDLSQHAGVHPRLGALDVVPFVALDGSAPEDAVDAAREFATWVASDL